MMGKNLNKSMLASMLMWMILLACGGGGGSESSSNPSPSSINYNGITTQAVLSEDNAMDLALGSYSAGAFGSFASGGTATQSTSSTGQFPNPYRQRMLRSVRSSILRLPIKVEPKLKTRRPLAASSDEVHGNCGGSLSVEIDVDESTGNFTGNFNYSDFCDSGVIIDGNGRLSGRANTAGEIRQFRMSFRSLAITEPEMSYAISGWIDTRLNDDGSVTERMDLLMRDDTTDKIYWANDYTIETTSFLTGTQSTMTGRYYDPDQGYVEIRTEVPLQAESYGTPTNGTLMVSGRNNTWVRMSFNEDGVCLLQADFNADNVVDWTDHYSIITQEHVNFRPEARAGTDRTVLVDTTVVLNGGLSYDPDNDPISYSWSFVSCPSGGNCPVLNDPNTSTPSFYAERTGRYVIQLVVNDGTLESEIDLIVINANSGTPSEPGLLSLKWMYGIFGTSIGESGLSSVDIDNDGSLEIIAGSSLAGFGPNSFWYVVRQDSEGQYSQIWSSSPYSASIKRIIPADVDGNGIFEIYVALENGNVIVYDGSSFSEIGNFTTGISLSTIAIGDSDGDGDIDIISSNGANLQIFSGQAYDLLWSTTTWGGASLAIGNVDNDASPEIVSTNANGHGYVINGADHELDWDYVNGFGNLVEVGDIDEDGVDEIVGAEAWYLITIYDADIKTPTKEIATDLDIAALYLADVDGDHTPEILYGDGQWGEIHCHDGSSLAELWSVANPEHGVGNIAIGDVDHDASLEVLWGAGGSSTGEDHLYIAGVHSRTIEWQSLHLDSPLSAMDVGDVDDDGQNEIVMVSFESNSNYDDGIIQIFDAQSHALEWRSADLPNIIAWSGVNSIKIGNVDGDSATEFVIATADTYSGVIQIYNGPTHTLERSSAEYNGTSFTKLAFGDVDNDGQIEIVAGQNWLTTGASGVHVVVFDGSTAAQEWQSSTLGDSSEVTDIVLNDIDNDGNIEIISSTDGYVYAFDGVTHQIDWLEEVESNALAVHDLNVDGQPDILLGRSTGDIAVYSFNNAAFALINTLYPTVVQSINALGVDDFDQDGSIEILIGGDDGLVIYNDNVDEIEWSSGKLGSNLGRYNHLVSRDMDGDGHKEIVIGSESSFVSFRVKPSVYPDSRIYTVGNRF